jgi:hypothetical protein
MKGKAIIVLMIFSFLAAFSGCAGTKIYLMDIKYIPEKKAPPTSKTVGICPFEDMRKEKGKETIGLRHRPRKTIDFLNLKGLSLSESVTQAVKDYFIEKGFEVTDCKGWDKSPGGLDSLPKDLSLVIGGKIDSFMVEARSGITITNIQYRVKMEALIGKIGERKVVIRTIESTPKDKKMGFDPDKVNAKLNSTLTEVIQKLFK